MANKKLGFVKLYRSLTEHWLWDSTEPFDDRSAWIDLIMMVNHEDKPLKIGKNIITIHAGQTWTSYVKLSNRWKWSKDRVFRYTKMLKKAGMIQIDATPNGTLLTLVNYGVFQNRSNTDKDTNKDTNKDDSKETNKDATKSQTRNIKNDKEIKEMKEEGRPPSPGEGYIWNEYVSRWIAPPKDGGIWQ